jgi:signal transduction histidine kinase
MPARVRRRDHLGIETTDDIATGCARPRPLHGPRGRHGPPFPLGGRVLGRHTPLRRDAEQPALGGVCAALAARSGRELSTIRCIAVVLACVAGFGVPLYVLAWLLVPREGEDGSIASRAVGDAVGIGIAVALVSIVGLGLFVVSALGLSFLGTFSAALLAGAGGLVLIWRNASPPEHALLERRVEPVVAALSASTRSRRALALRGVVALGLLSAGLVEVLDHARHGLALRQLSGLALVVLAAVVLLGPWWLRVGRDLVTERQARARAEEREEIACQLHDSVLQTLAMIQRRADQPGEVVRLARRQERELRAWLFEGRRSPGGDSLAAALRQIEDEVEADHGVVVDTVVVGDCPLDDRLRAFVAAGREAAVNAAKWSGAPAVSIFAEVDGGVVSMFVRDTGAGFEPAQVPADRRGISESVQGRMSRIGGQATIRSAPGAGTEVALVLPLTRSERGEPS